MKIRNSWIGMAVIAAFLSGAAVRADEVVLQDGGTVLDNPTPVTTTVNPPPDNTPSGTQDSPEPATLTLLGLGGLGALWKIRRRKNVAA
jgi:PEP-CTERM motif-containing protein